MNFSFKGFGFLEKRNKRFAPYAAKTILIGLVPTIAIALLVFPLFGHLVSDDDPKFSIVDVFGLAVFAPIVETILLVGIVGSLRYVGLQSRDGIVLATASVIAGLHSLFLAPWGLIVFWNFCVWTAVFLDWERRSRVKAFWITSLFHAFNNSIPAFAPLIYK